MTPTAAYLRAAGACVEAVAIAEGYQPDEYAGELNGYAAWATLLEPTLFE